MKKFYGGFSESPRVKGKDRYTFFMQKEDIKNKLYKMEYNEMYETIKNIFCYIDYMDNNKLSSEMVQALGEYVLDQDHDDEIRIEFDNFAWCISHLPLQPRLQDWLVTHLLNQGYRDVALEYFCHKDYPWIVKDNFNGGYIKEDGYINMLANARVEGSEVFNGRYMLDKKDKIFPFVEELCQRANIPYHMLKVLLNAKIPEFREMAKKALDKKGVYSTQFRDYTFRQFKYIVTPSGEIKKRTK